MLNDDFMRLGDARQVGNFVPFDELRKIEHELLYLFIDEVKAKFISGANKEFV